jgi:hypothetical protein
VSIQVLSPLIFDEVYKIVTGATSVLSVWYNVRQAREKKSLERKVKDVERGIVEPVRIEASEKRNSIVLLGVGGSGKTSLIKNIFHQKKATPERKTDEYTIFASSHAVDGQKYNFFVSDYVGQNLGNLVGSFIEQQKISYSEMTYGYINSLVLIVDLFPPKANPTDPEPQTEMEPNRDRVDYNLWQWNETAIDGVFGMLTVPELSYICLFINKYDLIREHSAESKRKIEKLYEKLFNYVCTKVAGLGVDCEMMIGSAGSGEQLTRLLSQFIKYSVPARATTLH